MPDGAGLSIRRVGSVWISAAVGCSVLVGLQVVEDRPLNAQGGAATVVKSTCICGSSRGCVIEGHAVLSRASVSMSFARLQEESAKDSAQYKWVRTFAFGANGPLALCSRFVANLSCGFGDRSGIRMRGRGCRVYIPPSKSLDHRY